MLSLCGRMRNGGREVDLDAEWRAVDDLKRGAESPVEEACRKYFEAEMKRVLSRLRAQRSGMRLDQPIAVEDVFSVQEAIDALLEAVAPALRDAVEAGFIAGLERIDESGPIFDSDDPAAQLVMEQVNDNLRNVPRRTRERINAIIMQGFADGEDLDTVAANIRNLYEGTDTTEGMTEARSKRIAQTSGTAAFERGQLVAFEEVGMGAKEWLTTRDGRQRDGHGEANFQVVEIQSPFSVRADEGLPFEDLQHPGDPTASVQNVVNCRCTMLPKRNVSNSE